MAPSTVSRPASAPDLPAVLELLAAAGLPTEGVAECIGEFRVLDRDGRVIAAAGLEPHGRVGLLRSVVVAAERRGGGLAALLCERLAADARERGIEALYLLTMDADGYFTRLGFRPVDRGRAPPAIRSCREFRELCPDSATLMCRALD